MEPEEMVGQNEHCSPITPISTSCSSAKHLRLLHCQEWIPSSKHTAREDKHRIRQFHNRKMPQIAQIHDMAGDAQEREKNGEAIDECEEELQTDDDVDEAREEFARQHGVFFD